MNPSIEWYSEESKKKGVTPRCPYANPQKCNKYYSSIYLLGELGIMTKISKEKQTELDEYWKESGLIPLIAEHEPGVTRANDNKLGSVCNFCPEVTFNVYGLFATSMHKYIDEIDRDYMHAILAREATSEEWRWNWMSINPLHYTECDIYSQLPYIKDSMRTGEELIEMKPGFMGFNINLKVLFKKFSSQAPNNLLQWIKKNFPFFSR